MADKYVKLNDIIETLEHEWGYEGMREDLYNLPAADVVEVVHGEWIVAEDDYGICATEFTCSHCKVSLVTSELTDGQFLDMMNYCLNCGAKMDGERKCEDG